MNYELKETILCLDNVELGYGHGSDYKSVLKDINILEKNVVRIDKTTGQNIAILGRSGRGKSTLLKALTGLIQPHSGRVLIRELDNPNEEAKIVQEGDVGFVDQKYTLFRHKTVSQILMYALRKSKKTKEEKSLIVKQYLNDWGLEKQKDQYPCELSGGQRQRTAIIEQMLCSGHFMIFDEPTSGLDLINIDDVKKSFNAIMESDDLNTIIFSTHNIHFAVEMADSIYVVGHPSNSSDYSTIVKRYDLKEMGLSWQPFGVKHIELVDEIKEIFKNS